MKIKNIFIFLSGFISLVLFNFSSCTTGPVSGVNPTPPPKIPDPVKQVNCKSGGSICEGNTDCEDICDDLFSGSSKRRNCKEYPVSLVNDIDQLIDDIEDGDNLDSIDPKTLDCLLDVDEERFAEAVKDETSSAEAKELLLEIAQSEDISKIFKDEDDEYNILETILAKASRSNQLFRYLQTEIDDNEIVPWVYASTNKYAWDWLNGFVDKYCTDDYPSSTSCPANKQDDELLGAYCNVLNKDLTESELKDFIRDADFFKDEFEGEIEDQNFEYAVRPSGYNYPTSQKYKGDFQDFCDNLSYCPNNGKKFILGNKTSRSYLNDDTGKDVDVHYVEIKEGEIVVGRIISKIALGGVPRIILQGAFFNRFSENTDQYMVFTLSTLTQQRFRMTPFSTQSVSNVITDFFTDFDSGKGKAFYVVFPTGVTVEKFTQAVEASNVEISFGLIPESSSNTQQCTPVL